ncbi:hypothetical protein [Terrimonas pollutisoli]|uniref:hypothetical protein n=1 Tax=Terrimonas pollutisoli TaxID=3034147 RepID=UPI0023EAB17B|nr:hypothetical protein [Terrimonas sp. H1YJ31]
MIGLKYIWQRWDINKKIDEIVAIGGNTPEENKRAWAGIKKLEEKVIDLYGDSPFIGNTLPSADEKNRHV